MDIGHILGAYNNAVKQGYGKRATQLPKEVQQAHDQALKGRWPEGPMPADVKVAILAMRQRIDSLSKLYMNALRGQIEDLVRVAERIDDGPERTAALKQATAKAALYDTIAGNLGEYVHRSYQAFDDPSWYKKVPNATINRARMFFIEQYQERGSDLHEATEDANRMVSDLLKRTTAYDSMPEFLIREPLLGAKDLSILMERKQLPKVIRELLGEYTEPRINFAKTTTKMNRLIHNQMFLDRVRQIGMGSFLWAPGSQPPEAVAQFPKGGARGVPADAIYAPLAGLRTYPEVIKAFQDALDPKVHNKAITAIIRLNGMVKTGKTVWAPTTVARNWMSASMFAIANGHFNLAHAKKSVEVIAEYFKHKGTKETQAYLQELKSLGVIYDSPYAGELMTLMRDAFATGDHGYALELDPQDFSGGVREKLVRTATFFQKTYQYGDDFWKIIGYENEKEMLIRAGMSQAEAKAEAAERIRNTYPTYSLVGSAIRSLARFPLVGTFVSFPSEIIRTRYHQMKYIAADWQAGRREMAARKVVGFVATAAIGWVLQEVTKNLYDIDDDEEEAIRLMGPPWSANSRIAFLGKNDQGQHEVLDLSHLDPYSLFSRPWTALFRDQPWEDAFFQSATEFASPFLGVDIAAGALLEAGTGMKFSTSGKAGQVWRNNDLVTVKIAKGAEHIRKALQPGVASNIERTLSAFQGRVRKSGQPYDIQDELLAWVGFRASTLDPRNALFYKGMDFNDAKRDASAHFNAIIRDPNGVTSEEIADALEYTNELRDRAYQKYHKVIRAVMQSGMPRAQVMRTLDAVDGLSKRDIHFLMSGKTPEYRISEQSQQKAVIGARSRRGAEAMQDLRRRYAEARRIAAGQN